MRIRWSGMWKVAAVAVAMVVAVQALPSLLRPPEPPPLAADVGLPRVSPEPAEPPPSERPKKAAGPAATEMIGSKPRPRRRHKRKRNLQRSSAPPAPPPPAAAPVPYEPPPPAPPPPAPAPTPASPSDGSEEFAPR